MYVQCLGNGRILKNIRTLSYLPCFNTKQLSDKNRLLKMQHANEKSFTQWNRRGKEKEYLDPSIRWLTSCIAKWWSKRVIFLDVRFKPMAQILITTRHPYRLQESPLLSAMIEVKKWKLCLVLGYLYSV